MHRALQRYLNKVVFVSYHKNPAGTPFVSLYKTSLFFVTLFIAVHKFCGKKSSLSTIHFPNISLRNNVLDSLSLLLFGVKSI